MPNSDRSVHWYTALALFGAIVWGLIEWFALWRSRRRERKSSLA